MRGGKREGAGRKKGSANKKTREIADRAAEEGITPLEVMLRTMRQLVDEGMMLEASEVASKAAPYLHPRLSSTTVSGKMDLAPSLDVVAAALGMPSKKGA